MAIRFFALCMLLHASFSLAAAEPLNCVKTVAVGPISLEQEELMVRGAKLLVRSSVLRMAAGRDSAFGDSYQAAAGLADESLKRLVDSLTGARYRHTLAQQVSLDTRAYEDEVKTQLASKDIFEDVVDCYSERVLLASGSPENEEVKDFLSFVQRRPSGGQVGHFSVSIDSCEVSDSMEELSFLGPQAWDESSFLVLSVSFRNTDVESRVPLAGSVVLATEGRRLEYDSTEAVLARGFGIGLQSVGPLLTFRTKLVYRVPKAVSGDFYWLAGRNAGQDGFWCGRF